MTDRFRPHSARPSPERGSRDRDVPEYAFDIRYGTRSCVARPASAVLRFSTSVTAAFVVVMLMGWMTVVRAAEEVVEGDTTLVEGGLLSQLFARVGSWVDGLVQQMALMTSAFRDLRRLGPWWAEVSSAPGAYEAIVVGTSWVVGILLLALALEWLAARLLRHPRLLVETHAQHRDAGSMVRRLPFALLHALIYLLPLAAFLVTTSTLSNAFLLGSRAFFVVLAVANAHAGVRIALAVTRLLISPKGDRLRLFHISQGTAVRAYRWAKAIFVTSGVGVALGESVLALGAPLNVQVLILKLTSLLVHILLIALIVHTRHSVARAIRGPAVPRTGKPRSGLATVRHFLADVWVVLAVVFVAALWFVWALSVDNGFIRVVHFIGVTAAVLIGARVVSIVGFGALDAGFSRLDPLTIDHASGGRGRYRVVLRAAFMVILTLGTIIVLLQVWGLPVMSWMGPGTVGRRLASATWTIAIAVLLAVLAWEAAGYAFQRRINGWTANGETLRVARLRTLLPILRSALLVVIGLVVLFTALSELGVNTAPLLASAGLLSAALAFGSQNLVKDFVTGIFLLMENTMQVGDGVTVAGVSGTVEHLSVRTVRLRGGDGSLFVVPFSSVTTVNNSNRGVGNAVVRVSVNADTDMNLVYEVLRDIGASMRADPKYKELILADLDIWGVDQIDGASATVAGQVRTVDRGRWPVQREINRRVLEQFRDKGIRLANPRETFVTQAQPTTTPPAGEVTTAG